MGGWWGELSECGASCLRSGMEIEIPKIEAVSVDGPLRTSSMWPGGLRPAASCSRL